MCLSLGTGGGFGGHEPPGPASIPGPGRPAPASPPLSAAVWREEVGGRACREPPPSPPRPVFLGVGAWNCPWGGSARRGAGARRCASFRAGFPAACSPRPASSRTGKGRPGRGGLPAEGRPVPGFGLMGSEVQSSALALRPLSSLGGSEGPSFPPAPPVPGSDREDMNEPACTISLTLAVTELLYSSRGAPGSSPLLGRGT